VTDRGLFYRPIHSVKAALPKRRRKKKKKKTQRKFFKYFKILKKNVI
jgi:hypothetical protein